MPSEVHLHGGGKGVRLRLPESGGFDRVLDRLGRKLTDGPSLAGKAVTIDAGRRELKAEELRALEAVILEEHGATLLQVVDGRSLPAASQPAPAAAPDVPGPPAQAWARPHPVASTSDRRVDLSADLAEDTVLVKRTLRSGQRVRYNGNVVVLGDVNPGAEVVASGDIVIMGTLRGVAHAGATGNSGSLVAAFRLQPTQLRIGAVIGRAPDGGEARPDAPEVARVREGVLLIERYQPAGSADMV